MNINALLYIKYLENKFLKKFKKASIKQKQRTKN